MEHIVDQERAAQVVVDCLEAANNHDPQIAAIVLGQDCTYFIPTAHGVDVTRQWYNGQTITNPADIKEIMKHHPVIRETVYAD